MEKMQMRAGSVSANGFALVETTQFWNVWSTTAFHAQHSADFDAARMSWLDASYRQLVEDLGFQPTLQTVRCYNGEHLDAVLDPAAPEEGATQPAGRGFEPSKALKSQAAFVQAR
jgi:hypothetical protein